MAPLARPCALHLPALSSFRLRGLLMGLLALLACQAQAPTKGAPAGELFAGEFKYICVSHNDAFDPCGVEQNFPETVAVDSEFRVVFRHSQDPQQGPREAEGDLPTVSASDHKLKQLRPGHYLVIDDGPVAVLATQQDPEQGQIVVDFLHLQAKVVDQLGVRTQPGNEDLNELRLLPGQPRELTVRPYAAGTRQLMAGSLPYTWSTSDRKVVELVTSPNGRSIGIMARREGVAVLTVSYKEIERSIDVVVESIPSDNNPDEGSR